MVLRKTSAILQLFSAVAIAVAMAWEITDRISHNVFRSTEYFSYVTIQICIATILIGLIAGFYALGNRHDPRWLTIAKLCVVTYMALVGLVYNLMLRGLPLSPDDALYPWPEIPNEIQHVVVPIVLVIDWFLVAGSAKLKHVDAWCIVFYPVNWAAWTIYNGIVGGWWPYWFMNPIRVGGPFGVAAYLVLMLAIMMILATAFIWVERSTFVARKILRRSL